VPLEGKFVGIALAIVRITLNVSGNHLTDGMCFKEEHNGVFYL
jgi:hypothetical protein